MSPVRAFRDEDARDAWNQAAAAWEDLVESGKDYYRHQVHGPGLLRACEPVHALKVLDLGCGQGWFSRELARRGAVVVAIDLSENLLDYAREHERDQPLGIEYHLLSAASARVQWPAASTWSRRVWLCRTWAHHPQRCPARIALSGLEVGRSFRYHTPAQILRTENGCEMREGSSSPS